MSFRSLSLVVWTEDRAITECVRRAVYLYSVCDGHKGPMCADFLSEKLHEFIKKQPGMVRESLKTYRNRPVIAIN